MPFQNWHKEFDKFDLSTRKSQKVSLKWALLSKVYIVELKKYRAVIFHETEEGYKVWRGIYLSFQNWHKEFDKFWPENSKVSKLELWWDLFVRSRKYMSLIFTGELCVMTVKNDTKIEEELSCHFKIGRGIICHDNEE